MMAEQEAQQEWRKRDGTYYVEQANGYTVAAVFHPRDLDRILADHKAQQEVRELREELAVARSAAESWAATAIAGEARERIAKEELARVKARAACTHDWRSISDPTKTREEGVIPAWCHWCGALKGYKLWEPSGGIEVGLLKAQLQAAEAERDKVKDALLFDFEDLIKQQADLTTTTTLLDRAKETLENDVYFTPETGDDLCCCCERSVVEGHSPLCEIGLVIAAIDAHEKA